MSGGNEYLSNIWPLSTWDELFQLQMGDRRPVFRHLASHQEGNVRVAVAAAIPPGGEHEGLDSVRLWPQVNGKPVMCGAVVGAPAAPQAIHGPVS